MKSRISAVIAGLLLVMTLIRPAQAASSFETFVGYVDNTHANASFPDGLCTGAFWNGASPIGSDCAGQLYDSGAIMMLNTGTTNLRVTGLTVNPDFDWGPLSFTLMPGQDAVFTQEDPFMEFDGSDFSSCCTLISFTVNGTTVRVRNNSGVLTNFGLDEGSSSACGVSGCNEGSPWVDIATSTVVVEPSTLALLGLGLAGIALTGRRRWS